MSSEKYPAVKLTFGEKVGAAKAIVAIVLQAASTALYHGLFRPSASRGVKKEVVMVLLTIFGKLSPRQKSIIPRPPSTGDSIRSYCKKHTIELSTTELPGNASVHIIGPSPSPNSRVLLYLHGGGYHHPATAHMPICTLLAKTSNSTLCMLEYTLSPSSPTYTDGRFPTQFQQAVHALKYVLTLTSPENVIIAGDSAGGHLLADLLSHLCHPDPRAPTIDLKPSENIGGMCFISPFCSFRYGESYSRNSKKDFLSLSQVEEFNSYFKPLSSTSGHPITNEEARKDPLLSPLTAPPDWHSSAPVKRIQVVYGTGEIFEDDCKAFGERLKRESGSDVDVVACEGDVHAACVLEEGMGLERGEMGRVVLRWMGSFV
ncbi:Alpha/Beta hydrolase protein [Halenospora varia]|nr:Alpha/Beta hydrolase protein [Halenospora varia]